MKQGKTLTELAAELDRQAGAKQDFIADTRSMRLSSNGTSHLQLACFNSSLVLLKGEGEEDHAAI